MNKNHKTNETEYTVIYSISSDHCCCRICFWYHFRRPPILPFFLGSQGDLTTYLEGRPALAAKAVEGVVAGSSVLAGSTCAAVRLQLRLNTIHPVLHRPKSCLETPQQSHRSASPVPNRNGRTPAGCGAGDQEAAGCRVAGIVARRTTPRALAGLDVELLRASLTVPSIARPTDGALAAVIRSVGVYAIHLGIQAAAAVVRLTFV